MARIAVIAGATGLVGSHCVRRLLEEPVYDRIIALVRRSALTPHSRLEQRIVAFEHLHELAFDSGADVFCALGTTIRTAGSQEAFRRVDHDYPVALAQRAAELNARSFLVVSSVGADVSTSNFYLRTKGEMERAISSLRVDAIHIFRPSLLLGNRQESRPAEKIAAVIAPKLAFLLAGALGKYRPVEADSVAAAMVRAAQTSARGVHVYHYEEIRRLSGPTGGSG